MCQVVTVNLHYSQFYVLKIAGAPEISHCQAGGAEHTEPMVWIEMANPMLLLHY